MTFLFQRFVYPEDQRPEIGDQRPEIRGRRPETRDRRPEIRGGQSLLRLRASEDKQGGGFVRVQKWANIGIIRPMNTLKTCQIAKISISHF